MRRWGAEFTGVIPSLHVSVCWKFSGSGVFNDSVREGGKGVCLAFLMSDSAMRPLPMRHLIQSCLKATAIL